MRLEGGRDVSVLSRIVKYSKSPASAKCPTKRIYFQKLLHFIPSYLRLLKILVTIRISYVAKVFADEFRWKDIFEWVPLSSTHPSVQYKKRQFNTAVSSTHEKMCWTDFFVLNWRFLCVELTFFVLNWRFCWSEAFCVELMLFGVELTGVLNWRFFVLNWRTLRAEKKWSLCWTDDIVLNWGVRFLDLVGLIKQKLSLFSFKNFLIRYWFWCWVFSWAPR